MAMKKHTRPDEIAFAAGDDLLTSLAELTIAYRAARPKNMTNGQRNVVIGHLQNVSDAIEQIMIAVAAVAVSIGLNIEPEATA